MFFKSRSSKKCITVAFLVGYLVGSSIASAYANTVMALPSYDLVPITPATWKEVGLQYDQQFNGHIRHAYVNLLRPIKWLDKNRMNRVGNTVLLNIPEYGLDDITAKVTAIKPTKIHFSAKQSDKAMPIIGVFKRYAKNVKTYQFKMDNGHIEKIHATPNHRFYLAKQHRYEAIGDIRANSLIGSISGKTAKLICPDNRQIHCGERYKKGAITPVYNLEIYRKHRYFVQQYPGQTPLRVHNDYFSKSETRPCSFSKDTLVKIAKRDSKGHIIYGKDGKPIFINKKIINVRKGDIAETYDVDKNELSYNRVLKLHHHLDGTSPDNQLVDVVVQDSQGHQYVIHTTSNHPFAVVTQ